MYWDKLGADNVLLMLMGVLHLALYVLKRREKHYKRLQVYLTDGIFYLGYGFLHDVYRIAALRPYFLRYYPNFLLWQEVLLLLLLLPGFVVLGRALVELWKARHLR